MARAAQRSLWLHHSSLGASVPGGLSAPSSYGSPLGDGAVVKKRVRCSYLLPLSKSAHQIEGVVVR